MKKLVLIATVLMAVNAEAATFTLYNYTDKPLVVHFAGVGFPTPPATTVPGHDVNLPAASMQNGVWTPGQFSDVLDTIYSTGAYYAFPDTFMGQSIPGTWVKHISVDNLLIDDYKHPDGNSELSYVENCDVVNQATGAFMGGSVPSTNSCEGRITLSHSALNKQAAMLSSELAQRFDALEKSLIDKNNQLNSVLSSNMTHMVQDEIEKPNGVVQTSLNNYLTTTSGTQTNLVNAVSTAMQSARDAAALDTKDYGVNNFYPSMTKQSSDGKYLVYPAQSFTLSGGCVLNAAPNNFLTVAQDANQEKNTTQLLTAMVLGRRVEITQHQKDAETTDCGVIDSVKILDK